MHFFYWLSTDSDTNGDSHFMKIRTLLLNEKYAGASASLSAILITIVHEAQHFEHGFLETLNEPDFVDSFIEQRARDFDQKYGAQFARYVNARYPNSCQQGIPR
jgi:hypothetical protein